MIVYHGFTVAEDRLNWWPLVSKSDGKEDVTSTEGKKKVFFVVNSLRFHSFSQQMHTIVI
jgi:hypothetical protein